jgi:hypothetical protein
MERIKCWHQNSQGSSSKWISGGTQRGGFLEEAIISPNGTSHRFHEREDTIPLINQILVKENEEEIQPNADSNCKHRVNWKYAQL